MPAMRFAGMELGVPPPPAPTGLCAYSISTYKTKSYFLFDKRGFSRELLCGAYGFAAKAPPTRRGQAAASSFSLTRRWPVSSCCVGWATAWSGLRLLVRLRLAQSPWMG